MKEPIASLFNATIKVLGGAPDGALGRHAFIEEYDDYFALSVEVGRRSVRVTHYYDASTKLIVLYGELLDGSGSGLSLDNVLRLSFGHGPFRFALGDAGELCLRADYDPSWNDAVAPSFAADVVNSIGELLNAAELRAAPGADRPKALHVADAVENDCTISRETVDVRRELESCFGDALRADRDFWSVQLTTSERSYLCIARIVNARLALYIDSASEMQSTAPVLQAALRHNYHIRFVKLCLVGATQRAVATELPFSMISKNLLDYFARRLPLYADQIRGHLPDFL